MSSVDACSFAVADSMHSDSVNKDRVHNSNKGKPLLDQAAQELRALFAAARVCVSHGMEHAQIVMQHAWLALLAATLVISEDEQLAVLLAALLHDADDVKFFPEHRRLENARAIVDRVCPRLTERVLQLISYVSTAKNRNTVPDEAASQPWVLYPRYADRLEAMGTTGIWRCWQYCQTKRMPLYTPDTERARDTDDLKQRIATPARYATYQGDSRSMIDHYYDKLLHIGAFQSGNAYLDDEAQRRQQPLIDLCLQFGREGRIDDDTVLDACGGARTLSSLNGGQV